MFLGNCSCGHDCRVGNILEEVKLCTGRVVECGACSGETEVPDLAITVLRTQVCMYTVSMQRVVS